MYQSDKIGLMQEVNHQVTSLSRYLNFDYSLTHTTLPFPPNPWLGIGSNPDKDLDFKGVVCTEKHILQLFDQKSKMFVKNCNFATK